MKTTDSPKNIDIFIVEDVQNASKESEEKTVRNLLRIPPVESENVALRISNKSNEVIQYSSTRMNTIQKDKDGLCCDVTGRAKELIGCGYEITEQGGSKKVLLKGKISSKKAEANVVSMGKTGS